MLSDICLRLIAARELACLSQEHVARLLRIDLATVLLYESGLLAPTDAYFALLAERSRIPVKTLKTGKYDTPYYFAE